MTAPESPRPSDVEAAREALALDRIVADLALTDEASEIAMLLNDHAYVPSGLRGVSRCACGVKCHGMPHEWRNHVATVLADVDHHRTDQGGALGEVERAPELGRLYDRLMQVTEHRDVRKYGEEHTPFSNGARAMAVAVRAEFEALFRDFRAKAEGTTETPDAATCRHGQPEDGCPSCAACAACDGSCGTCPYATTETPDAPRGPEHDHLYMAGPSADCPRCQHPRSAPPAAPDTGGETTRRTLPYCDSDCPPNGHTTACDRRYHTGGGRR